MSSIRKSPTWPLFFCVLLASPCAIAHAGSGGGAGVGNTTAGSAPNDAPPPPGSAVDGRAGADAKSKPHKTKRSKDSSTDTRK